MEVSIGLTTAEPTAPDPQAAAELELLKVKLPEDLDYANEQDYPDVYAQIVNEVAPLVKQTRLDRKGMESVWMTIRNTDMMEHDENRKYMGRSKNYIPLANRNYDTLVSSIVRGLFPSDDYMDVVDRKESSAESSKEVKGFIQYEFDSVARIRRHMKPFVRQGVMYGTTPMKHGWREKKAPEAKLSLDKFGNVGGVMGSINCDGLVLNTRNLFKWYVYPQTVATLDEAVMVFEDIDVPLYYIKEQILKKMWPEHAEHAPPLTDTSAESDLKAKAGLNTQPDAQQNIGGDLGQMRTITEVWTFMKLPKEAYVDGEDQETRLPVKVLLAGDRAISVRRNPFWHQTFPYVVGRVNPQPGLFYGQGFGHKVKGIQHLVNDLANQTNDVGIYGLNPVVKRVPGLMTGPMKPLAPGVVWDMADTKAVEFDRPPIEQIQFGMQLLMMWIGHGQDFGGAPPIVQGLKGAKTATGSQILQRNAQVPLQDVVEDFEQDVMIPLMKATWILGQQYAKGELILQITGKPMKLKMPQALAAEVEFRYLASSQSASAQQRAQQAIQLLQAIAGPVSQELTIKGYNVDLAPLLRRIFTDGLGFRGFDSIVSKMQAVPGMPGALPPGAPGAAAPQPGQAPVDRVRSAVEQVTGEEGAPDMVAGEGDAFMEVRSEADDMAAAYGGIAP